VFCSAFLYLQFGQIIFVKEYRCKSYSLNVGELTKGGNKAEKQYVNNFSTGYGVGLRDPRLGPQMLPEAAGPRGPCHSSLGQVIKLCRSFSQCCHS